jgi:glycosyltransferase involved in cell wall biosynthesis
MKKNLFFFLPNFSPGGAGKSITNLCKYLDKKKYDLYIISLNKNSYKKELSRYCKKIYEINSKKTIFAFLDIVKILKKFDKKKTIFISNINYANLLTLIFLKILNTFKVVVTERTPFQELNYYYSYIDLIKKKIMKFLIPFLYKRSDLIICNSRKNSSDLSKFINKKCDFVYPILPNKIIKKKKIKKNDNSFYILSIGRYSKEKRFFDIINAISLIKNRNIKLFLVGNGMEKDNLKNHINKFKIKAKLIKFTKKNEIKYFNKSHLFISSSDFEGYPNTVVQAINNNLPVISSQSHGAINEILLNEKGGTYYKKRNIKDLSNKIIYVIKNYKKSLNKTYYAKTKLNRFFPINSISKFDFLINKIK